MNMAYIFYASANQEAAALFAADLNADEYAVMFANSEVLANSEVYLHLPRHILELYSELWVELKG
jgi:hypothetical protein